MNTQSTDGKTHIVRMVAESLHSISNDTDRASEYLISEGLDPDKIRREGMKRVKNIEFRLAAQRTKSEMKSVESVKEKVVAYVNNLLANPAFSFANFIKTEQLSLQNRSTESLSQEDIQTTLVQYYTLKFMETPEKKDDGL